MTPRRVRQLGARSTQLGARRRQHDTDAHRPRFRNGGTITIGAEQEPDCFDWIGPCAGSAWGSWMAQLETQPQAFRAVVDRTAARQWQPGAVLTGMPTFETTPVETITYNINPAAVWSDGVPITCADFQYTADQQQNGNDIYDRTGYVDIDNGHVPDAEDRRRQVQAGQDVRELAVAVRGRRRHPAVAHPEGQGPRQADEGRLHVVGWSVVRQVEQGRHRSSSRRTRTTGARSRTSTRSCSSSRPTPSAEFQAFKSGQVDAIYPQPQLDVVDAIRQGLPDANTRVQRRRPASVEALWLNNSKRSRSTRRPCARRSATRSTATRS